MCNKTNGEKISPKHKLLIAQEKKNIYFVMYCLCVNVHV